jgi:hypothetical protein
MKAFRIAVPTLAAALLVSTVVFADSKQGAKLVSGPQVDQTVPGPFHPLNVTGKAAGEKHCLYCENGDNPVAMIFARETSPELTALLKKIDAVTEQNKNHDMGSFVVFLSDKEGLDKDLQKLATDAGLKKVVLSIDNPAGPQKYKVSKEADVTVVLYKEHVVKANYAFKKGQLKEHDVEKIVGDVSKILPGSK